MKNVIEILIFSSLFFLIFGIIFFFLWRKCSREIKAQKGTIERLSNLIQENEIGRQRLEEVVEAVNDNREEANEKIDELHHGDTLGNALDGLHKH